MIDPGYTDCIVPLHQVLGPNWREIDMLRLAEVDVSQQLLVAPTTGQRQALTTAINGVIRSMMPRFRRRGLYTLAQMEVHYKSQAVRLVGPIGRALLDALFAGPEPEPQIPERVYHYPLLTTCGIAYSAPVTTQRNCDLCAQRDLCHTLVTQHDGAALCEHVLPNEVLSENYGGSYDTRRISETCLADAPGAKGFFQPAHADGVYRSQDVRAQGG